MNRIAVQAPETPLQALDVVHGGIIAAMVARAVKGCTGLVCHSRRVYALDIATRVDK